MRGTMARPAGTIHRRDFLRMTAAGGALVLGGTFSSRAFAVDCEAGGPLNLFTYQGYDGAGLPLWDAFWSDRDIEVNLRALGNEDLLQVLKSPGGELWDTFQINQGDNMRTWDQDVMSPVTIDEVPNLANVYANVANNPIWRNEDGSFKCVPLTIGPLGIHWNAETHPEGFKSYADALDPELRVSCLDSSLNMISTGACAVGLDPAVLTREQLHGPVRDWLMKMRPQAKAIATSLGDQLTLLINNEVDLHLVGFPWNVLQAKQQGATIGFVIPSEGSYGFVDSIAISSKAPNRCNAIAYCNAALDPALGAQLNDSLVGLGGTPEINAELSPETRALFPEDLQADFFGALKWNVSHADPNGPYAVVSEWDAVWNEVKLAG